MKMSRRACFFLAYTLATTAPLVCSEALENGTSRSERRECVNRTKNGGENIVAGVALYLSGATSFFIRSIVALEDTSQSYQLPSMHPFEMAALSTGGFLLGIGMAQRRASQRARK